ncbi:hypothetical protein ACWDYH_07805 [Nocardia goodfellowii]
MNDAPTPQDLLSIASSTTMQARRAASMPGWVPPTAGLLGSSSLILAGVARPELDNAVFWPILSVAAAIFCVFLVLVTWVSHRQRKIGVVSRALADEPTRRWQRILVYSLPIVIAIAVNGFLTANPLLDGWVHVVFALLLGGCTWWALERRRVATCRN